ncbi:hypothetical protein FNF28_01762 [Cafeteria roenbergensis]|uniref:ABC transporter domain-containing protein n=4 Tax=Cafeteria roenbergensis TaxID=33653 RepID=A0A5A8DWV0_CAFRO|nr:hypothetical protein FNF28_01762 [Cafeteria roenbergensis]
MPHSVAFCPQRDDLHDDLTPFQILALHARVRGAADASDAERLSLVSDVIAALGLQHVAHNRVRQPRASGGGLSGGELRRLSLACELVTRPTLLGADEVTSGLDASAALSLALLLNRLSRAGILVVCVVHQPRVEVLAAFDRVLLLTPYGQPAFLGPRALLRRYVTHCLGITVHSSCNIADVALDVVSGVATSCPEDRMPITAWSQRCPMVGVQAALAERRQALAGTVAEPTAAAGSGDAVRAGRVRPLQLPPSFPTKSAKPHKHVPESAAPEAKPRLGTGGKPAVSAERKNPSESGSMGHGGQAASTGAGASGEAAAGAGAAWDDGVEAGADTTAAAAAAAQIGDEVPWQSREPVPFCTQLMWMLLRDAWLVYVARPSRLVLSFALACFFGAVPGLLYDTADLTAISQWIWVMSLAAGFFAITATLPHIRRESSIVAREAESGTSQLAYALAKIVSVAPLVALQAAVMAASSMVYADPASLTLGEVTLICWLVMLQATAVGNIIAFTMPDASGAQLLAVLIALINPLVAGLLPTLRELEEMGGGFVAVSRLSWSYYALSLGWCWETRDFYLLSSFPGQSAEDVFGHDCQAVRASPWGAVIGPQLAVTFVAFAVFVLLVARRTKRGAAEGGVCGCCGLCQALGGCFAGVWGRCRAACGRT